MRRWPAALLAAFACFCSVAQQPTMRDRLDRLSVMFESMRVDDAVPGMALAVVLEDEIVLARGFGVADLATETPVRPDTLFEIGSTTKAFTAALVGMLADDGKLTWDDPVSVHLPYFELKVDSRKRGAVATLRDLLSHRAGFRRMGVLFVSGGASPEEILRAAARAEPVGLFRREFYYNNVLYLAAGTASAAVAGIEWEALLRDRLLEPLGMSDTTVSPAAVDDPRHATGYIWDFDEEANVELDRLPLDSVAPCGAMHSHVRDMAKWLRMLLARGEHDGRRLIAESTLAETWTPQVLVEEGVGYGLGWFVRRWDGETWLEHGGNTNGFSAQVGLLPELGAGFVLLTNADQTYLQDISDVVVWETLFGDLERAEELALGEPSEESDETPAGAGEELYEGDFYSEEWESGEEETGPSLDQLIGLASTERQRRALLRGEGFEVRGRIQVRNAGAEGELRVRFADQWCRTDIDLGAFGRSVAVVHPAGGWIRSDVERSRDLDPREVSPFWMDPLALGAFDWRGYFDAAFVDGEDAVGDTPVWVLDLDDEEAHARTLFFDQESGQLLHREAYVPYYVETTFSDYREVEGLRFPFRFEWEDSADGVVVWEIDEVVAGVELADALFARPADDGR